MLAASCLLCTIALTPTADREAVATVAADDSPRPRADGASGTRLHAPDPADAVAQQSCGALRVRIAAPMTLSLDGRPLTATELVLPVGEHAVLVRVGERQRDFIVEVRAQTLTELDLRDPNGELAPVTHVPLAVAATRDSAPAAASTGTPGSTWLLGAAAAGGVLGAVTAYLAGLTWWFAVDTQRQAVSWAVDTYGGAPPDDAPGLDSNYLQPMARSARLELVTTVLGVCSAVLVSAAVGALGGELVLGLMGAQEDETPVQAIGPAD